jgi:hypothetical protein
MKSGIKFKDIETGSGQEVKGEDSVLAEVRYFLNKGEEINIFQGNPDHQFVIHLKSRDFIPGLRYGIVGMREGGTRELKISPHLAFGEEGISNKIPSNAVIICNVKLLRIVPNDFRLPTPYDRKRQIIAAHRGEAARNLPRWSFGIINDGQYGITVNYPIPGMTWRHTRNRYYEAEIRKEEMDQLFEEIQTFTNRFPEDVVLYENVWADMSEPAGNTARERSTDRLCISVMFFKEPAPFETFYITEDNQRFQNTALFRLIATLLNKPELK